MKKIFFIFIFGIVILGIVVSSIPGLYNIAIFITWTSGFFTFFELVLGLYSTEKILEHYPSIELYNKDNLPGWADLCLYTFIILAFAYHASYIYAISWLFIGSVDALTRNIVTKAYSADKPKKRHFFIADNPDNTNII